MLSGFGPGWMTCPQSSENSLIGSFISSLTTVRWYNTCQLFCFIRASPDSSHFSKILLLKFNHAGASHSIEDIIVESYAYKFTVAQALLYSFSSINAVIFLH